MNFLLHYFSLLFLFLKHEVSIIAQVGIREKVGRFYLMYLLILFFSFFLSISLEIQANKFRGYFELNRLIKMFVIILRAEK